MHVLVTGGGGYIGLELCRQLLERGNRVRVVDRFFFGRRPLEELAAQFTDRLEIVHADIRDFREVWLDGIDGVSHLAGLSNDPTAEYNPDANWEMNAVATERLAQACKAVGVSRLVFGSSASLYDGLGPGLYDETSDVRPRGAYSKSKRWAEEALIAAADDDFSPTIIRQGTVFGFSTRMRFDLVVNTFLKDAITQRKLFLHGGGWQWRPLVDVSDVARGHIVALEAPRSIVHAEIFNLMQENYQVRQLAMLVAGSLALIGKNIELVEAPMPAFVRDYRMSNLKMTQLLQFTPSVSVLESIDVMLKNVELGESNLLSPRHCNIAWMTLLEEVYESQKSFASIY